jgi:hypothetical protein
MVTDTLSGTPSLPTLSKMHFLSKGEDLPPHRFIDVTHQPNGHDPG